MQPIALKLPRIEIKRDLLRGVIARRTIITYVSAVWRATVNCIFFTFSTQSFHLSMTITSPKTELGLNAFILL
jgi:hypothetical protein